MRREEMRGDRGKADHREKVSRFRPSAAHAAKKQAPPPPVAADTFDNNGLFPLTAGDGYPALRPDRDAAPECYRHPQWSKGGGRSPPAWSVGEWRAERAG